MSGNAVGWFEIYVQDMDRARRFYEAVLGKALQKLDSPAGEIDMWSFPGDQSSYGIGGALAKMPGVASGGNSTVVYFSCEDCAVEEGRVAANGGRVMRPKFPIGQYGFIALAFDTEGNLFGLHSMK